MTDRFAFPFHQPLLRLGQDTLGDYSAFTDESAISGHRFMIVGGISCRSHHAEEIHARVAAIRAESRYADSMQWKYFRPEKYESYKKLIDYFFTKNQSHRIDYSCIVIERKGLDHAKYNDGDGEIFFQKIMYQLAISLTRKYNYPKSIRIFHGIRSSRFDLAEIQKL